MDRLVFATLCIVLCSTFSPGRGGAQPGHVAPFMAQKLAFEHLTTAHGLSHDWVECIYQDREGFLWFGTFSGLNRYDGYEFKVYKHDPTDSASISQDWVISICEDDSGYLYVGTRGGGLNRFDNQTGRFQQINLSLGGSGNKTARNANVLYNNGRGVIWIGTEKGGVFKLDPKNTGSIDRHQLLGVLEIPGSKWGCLDLLSGQEQILWIATGGQGLFKFDEKTGEFSQFKFNVSGSETNAANIIKSIWQYSPDTLLIGTGFWASGKGNGLKLFDTKTGTFADFPILGGKTKSSQVIVHSIFKDHAENFWIGTDGAGLWRFSTNEQKITVSQLSHNPLDPLSLGDNRVSTVFEDRAGNIWIGTRENGASKLSPQKNQFHKFSRIEGQENTLSYKSVSCFGEDSRGNLWIGTDGGGLNKMNLRTGEIDHFKNEPDDPKSLAHDVVSAIWEDRAGTLWIGTEAGLSKFDERNSQFSHLRHNPDDPFSLSDNGVFTIFEDQSRTLWIGTRRGGLNRFDRALNRFTRFVHHASDPGTISSNAVMKILEAENGDLWICTFNGGLNKLEKHSGKFIHYMNDPQDSTSISHNSVETIHQDKNGSYWVATWGGLNRFDPTTGKFVHYTQKDGLPDNVIYGLLEDDENYLWLSTPRGLSKFNPRTGTFRNYDKADGLHDNAFTEFAYFRSSSTGMMFFGGGRGFTAFHPSGLYNNYQVPQVMITGVTLLNQASRAPHLSPSSEAIRLVHSDNFFTFQFAALDFTQSSKNQYRYKLEGIDPRWVDSERRNFASYTNVPPGHYTFRVKGSNNDGVWNEEGASLELTIVPPWWKTDWAYIFYTLLLFMAVYFGRRYELHRQRLKYDLELEHAHAEKLQELDRMKSRFFANISHEFRTPMTLILGPLEKLLGQIDQPHLRNSLLLMQRNGQRLLRLINQLLDLSKLEAGKMTLQAAPYDLETVLKPIVMAFESLAGLKEIELRFVPPKEPVTPYLDRDKFEKIISNLLSNAFKFTEAGGSVIVEVIPPIPPLIRGEIKGEVEIRITDTGPGIPAEQLPHIFDRFYQAQDSGTGEQGSGIGLALTKELVELHHGEIRVESEEGNGSTFIVRCPLGKAHLQAEDILDSSNNLEQSEAPIVYSSIADLGLRIADSKEQDRSEIRDPKSQIVLIVEDNPDMRSYIREHLSGGYLIHEAPDGAQGFREALKQNPDLIVSDVMMPEMDGYELCAKLKSDARTSHIPVILLTARAGDESKLEGLETGADDYLTKPFNPRELQVRVRNLIAQRQRLREQFREQVLIQPSEITATSMDARFLEKAMAFVEAHLDDPVLDVTHLSEEMALSRSQLNRKLKALTGQSASEFIRCLRLKRAAQLLEQHSGNISEIAYEVGFNNPAHFAECFRKMFGVKPSQYVSN